MVRKWLGTKWSKAVNALQQRQQTCSGHFALSGLPFPLTIKVAPAAACTTTPAASTASTRASVS